MATSDEWAKRVSAWRASGLTAHEFAERRGWNSRTLMWWASALKKRGISSKPEPAGVVHFARVVTNESGSRRPSEAASMEVGLPRGCSVRVFSGFSVELFRAIVDALEGT